MARVLLLEQVLLEQVLVAPVLVLERAPWLEQGARVARREPVARREQVEPGQEQVRRAPRLEPVARREQGARREQVEPGQVEPGQVARPNLHQMHRSPRPLQ